MPKQDAVAELARKLVETLQREREVGPDRYPLTVGRLAELADPQAAPEQVQKALSKKPFAEQLMVARKKDPASPIALREDAGRLAEGTLLLEYALGLVCTAEKPLHPPARVVGKVDKALQPLFTAALERRIADNNWPEAVGQVSVKGKPQLYLRRFPPPPPKKKPAEELSEKLLHALQTRRAEGGSAYPVPLNDLAAGVDPTVKPSLVKQAVAAEPFRSQALVAAPSRPNSPVALTDDRDRLTSSEVLLLYLLESTTSARAPLANPDRLAGLLDPALRDIFNESLHRRLAEQALPEGVETIGGGQGPELALKRFLRPAHLLALKMGRALRERKERADDGYPLTLGQLVAQVEPAAPPDLIRQALAEKDLKGKVLLALPNSPDSPLALTEDAEQLADWPPLLAAVVAAIRTEDNQAPPAAGLGKKLARPLQGTFAQTIRRHLQEHTLPPGVGLLRIKGKEHLFLLEDVSSSWPTLAETPRREVPPPARQPATEPEPAPAPEPIDFPRLFDEAFERLDRERGSHNLVSLVRLRQEVPVDRARFDAGLHDLRRAGRYTLSAAEGRHGLSPEEQAAGIREDGSLLLWVSRRAP
jgi:hypothetical protein